MTGRCLDVGVPYASLSDNDEEWAVLAAWGHGLRLGRAAAGLSQAGLERRSGVDQTQISRFERGLAARMPAERLARLGLVLGHWFPLGRCPHDHDCMWHEARPGTGITLTRDRYDDWRRATKASPPPVIPRPPEDPPANARENGESDDGSVLVRPWWDLHL